MSVLMHIAINACETTQDDTVGPLIVLIIMKNSIVCPQTAFPTAIQKEQQGGALPWTKWAN